MEVGNGCLTGPGFSLRNILELKRNIFFKRNILEFDRGFGYTALWILINATELFTLTWLILLYVNFKNGAGMFTIQAPEK